MKNENLIICSQSEIAFDSGTHFKRCSEGEQAVFRKAGAVMEAAVSETPRSRVEGIRP